MAVSTAVATNVQRQVNETYQYAQNICSANCSQLISGNVIVLDNTTAGDITFTQRCTADASCMMTNSLDSLVEAYQDAKVVAEGKPAFFPGIQVNTTVTTNVQEIKNEMTQIMENLCTADVNQVIQDNIVYATDSTVENIGFLQEGNASADCVMENVGRLKAQMRQDGDVTAASGGTWGGIAGGIFLVIIIIVIVYAVISFNKNKRTQRTSSGGTTGGGRTLSPGSVISSPTLQSSTNTNLQSLLLSRRGR